MQKRKGQTRDDLRNEIAHFDGRHIDVLERILDTHQATGPFLSNLVLLISDEQQNVQMGAMWMLKELVESDVKLSKTQLVALFDSLPDLNHWLPKLHVCQMLQYLRIPPESKRNLCRFLEQNLLESNKFVKAWSYNGFFELAKQHPEYFDYTMEQIERAEAEGAASIRARLRNIRSAMRKLAGTRPGR